MRKIKEYAQNYTDGEEVTLSRLLYLVFFNQAFQLFLFYKLSQRLDIKFHNKRFFWIIPKIVLYFEKVLIGSYIDPRAKIGKGFKIHYGMGIVIGEKVEIGDNVTIFNGVTLGSVFPGRSEIKQPKIGNNVFIGSGAKVLGGITIGDNVKIGANAVVLKSFGPNVTIAGVPGKIVKKNN